MGYLGDPDENGGSADNPLRPHLHFGVRAGQRADYPGIGQWRWMAGWIEPCPSDVGWLKPSAVINGQAAPAAGFQRPSGMFWQAWWVVILFAAIYVVCGVCMVVFAAAKRKPVILFAACVAFSVIGVVLGRKDARLGAALFTMAGLLAASGVYLLLRVRRRVQALT